MMNRSVCSQFAVLSNSNWSPSGCGGVVAFSGGIIAVIGSVEVFGVDVRIVVFVVGCVHVRIHVVVG